jgi:type I restriction-modification system DNA methylase subunit
VSAKIQSFETQLATFGMVRKESGLYFVAERSPEDDPSIYFGLEMAHRFGATAVYFRQVGPDSKSYKPEAYIFEVRSLSGEGEMQILEQLRHVWNAGIVPLCYYFLPTEIKIFNAWNAADSAEFEPTLLHHFRELENLNAELVKDYHARMIDSGLFWENEVGKTKFDSSKTAYRKLLEAVSAVKNHLVKSLRQQNKAQTQEEKAHLEKSIRLVKRLIVMAILIKYLEDRKTTDGIAAIDEAFFRRICDLSNLGDVFRNKRACLNLFEKLAEKDSLNGEVFSLSAEEQTIFGQLGQQVFEWIALFVEGELEWAGDSRPLSAQLKLFRWKLYSFDYLPIELISHIYEDFIGEEGVGVVYTPPQLVQFLLDECLPLHRDSPQRPRVLDPACGSGIFLVGVYKRLIQLWRLAHGWKKPGQDDIPALQALLHDCIYGCDIGDEGGAVQLTYFSLSLALLDALSPADIMPNVHFKPLIGSNLHGKDFFEVADQLGKFDLIVGNPPFDSKLTKPAIHSMKALGYNLRDNQIAMAFQAKCQEMLNESGKSCLILPSGPLLYSPTGFEFRRQLFSKANINAILDFTPLRSSLFKSNSKPKKPIVAAALVHNTAASTSWVKHIVFRQTTSAALNATFETDAYDTNWVSREDIDTFPGIWQINFMGGGERLKMLVRRLDRHQSIDDYVNEKSNWRKGEGWQLAPIQKNVRRARHLASKLHLSESEELEFKALCDSHEGTWITGKPYLETDSLTTSGIDPEGIQTCGERFFHRPRKGNKEIFLAPHILIKESAKAGENLPIAFLEEDLTFKHQILGIHAPEAELDALQALYEYLTSTSLGPLLWLTSGRIIGMREGVPLAKDILALPYPLPEIYPIEQVLLEDIMQYQAEFRIKGAKSKVLNPIRSADDSILQDFKTWFLRVSNSDGEEFSEAKTLVGDNFICMAFAWGGPPQIDLASTWSELEGQLAGLLEYQHSHQLWIQRILRIYASNVILLVKPNQIRYWTRSIAINDADSTFADMIAQGL